jgi:hypothetical protein
VQGHDRRHAGHPRHRDRARAGALGVGVNDLDVALADDPLEPGGHAEAIERVGILRQDVARNAGISNHLDRQRRVERLGS